MSKLASITEGKKAMVRKTVTGMVSRRFLELEQRGEVERFFDDAGEVRWRKATAKRQ